MRCCEHAPRKYLLTFASIGVQKLYSSKDVIDQGSVPVQSLETALELKIRLVFGAWTQIVPTKIIKLLFMHIDIVQPLEQ